MTTVDMVDRDLQDALKARQTLRLSVLRMMKSALKLKQVELGKPLEEAEAFAVLRTMVKQRQEAADLFRQAGRTDLAEKEEEEIRILGAYLPARPAPEEVEAAIRAALEETRASGPKDAGKVMKAVMAKLSGKTVDGKQVSEMVRARLGGA